jgi:U32 family peptidase
MNLKKIINNKAELLAPAGSLESFFAAMEKGADAVYAGLQEFSARARAKNFSISQMERMVAYAHSLDRKVYITLNTLVKEKELPHLVDTLAALSEMRADGVIVQDLAVARLVRNHFPSLELHASTQMTVHNGPGVRMLGELGFTRAVLARELALDEVAAITASTDVEIETFVHGALCFSISGQCFFSSYLGGHSGNRGRCAQPCRRLYDHRGKQGHYFSTSDLSAIEMIPDLVRAGVKSLKIEGRMRSAEYVACVVEAYRMVMDAPEKDLKEAVRAGKELLKYSFGRTPTKGFLSAQQPDDIANPWQKGGTGRFIGQIKAIKGNRLTFETRDHLFVGDRLRAQPKSDMAGQAWTLRELFCSRKKVMEARPGSTVEVETPFRFSVGDSIYKVSSREAFTMSENACNRRLQAIKKDKLPCSLTIRLVDEQLFIQADVAGNLYDFQFQLGQLEEARSTDMQGVLLSQFSKTGEAPFRLDSLQATDFPPVLIPASHFKEIRRQLYANLDEAVTQKFNELNAKARRTALNDVMSVHPVDRSAGQSTGGRETLTLLIDQPRDWRFPFQLGADFTMLTLTKAAIHQLPSSVPRMRDSEDKIIWQLPFIIFERDMELYRDTLKQLYRAGFRRFEAANISHFNLLRKFEGIHISTWHRCFSLNSQALKSWQELGAETATLYIEDDAENLSDLLSTAIGITQRIIAYAPLPVMTTKIKMKDVHSNTPLQSDRGEEYRVTTRDGLQTITAAIPFSLTARHHELRHNGCRAFLIDLRQADRESWGNIIGAFKASRELPGTTEFNYAQGLV